MTFRDGARDRCKAIDVESRPLGKIAIAAATLLLAAMIMLCVLRPFSLQYPASGLDPAWAMVLGEAAEHSTRWGVDLIFTYGPASALMTRYFTENYFSSALPTLAVISVVQSLCMTLLLVNAGDGQPDRLLFRTVAVAALTAAIVSNAILDQDALYFAFALVVFLLDVQRPRSHRVMSLAVHLGAGVLAIAALGKTSYGVAGFLLLLLADARSAAMRRRPSLTLAFVASFLVAFAVYGQRFGDLPSYIVMQGQVAMGYGEAMYVAGPRGEIAVFVTLAAALLCAVAIAERSHRSRTRRVLLPLGLAIVLLVAFKAGFVREDTHPQIAWGLLGFSALMLAVSVFRAQSTLMATGVGAASLLVLWVVAPGYFLLDTQRSPDPGSILELYGEWFDSIRSEATSLRAFIANPSETVELARTAKAATIEGIRREHPLPKLDGTVDMLPSDQGTLLANGLDYRPRPSFAEYTTYTAGLIEANRKYYSGGSAPEWMIFDFGGLDDRYPATSEGEIWPDLWQRYEPRTDAGDHIALRRRVKALPAVLGPPQASSAKLGQPFALPTGGPLYARIVVRKTALGSIAAALFRPPGLALRVRLSDGGDRVYRFIPALGAGGFLLSPMVDDPHEFAALGFGRMMSPNAKTVTEFEIGGSRLNRLFYEEDIGVELQPLIIAPGEPSAEAQAFYDKFIAGQR